MSGKLCDRCRVLDGDMVVRIYGHIGAPWGWVRGFEIRLCNGCDVEMDRLGDDDSTEVRIVFDEDEGTATVEVESLGRSPKEPTADVRTSTTQQRRSLMHYRRLGSTRTTTALHRSRCSAS